MRIKINRRQLLRQVSFNKLLYFYIQMERLEATIGVFLLMFGAAGAWDQLMLIKYLDDEGQIQKARTKVVYLYTPMIAIAFVFLAIGFRFGS